VKGRDYNLFGGKPHLLRHWMGGRWLWKAGLEWKAQDLWIGVFHRSIAEGKEVWVCLVPCLPFHAEWWCIGRAIKEEGRWL
jgi:hypothetical protein